MARAGTGLFRAARHARLHAALGVLPGARAAGRGGLPPRPAQRAHLHRRAAGGRARRPQGAPAPLGLRALLAGGRPALGRLRPHPRPGRGAQRARRPALLGPRGAGPGPLPPVRRAGARPHLLRRARAAGPGARQRAPGGAPHEHHGRAAPRAEEAPGGRRLLPGALAARRGAPDGRRGPGAAAPGGRERQPQRPRRQPDAHRGDAPRARPRGGAAARRAHPLRPAAGRPAPGRGRPGRRPHGGHRAPAPGGRPGRRPPRPARRGRRPLRPPPRRPLLEAPSRRGGARGRRGVRGSSSPR